MVQAAVARALAGAVALALLCGPPGLLAQARERVLYVSVFDKETRKPVADLGPPAFVVREDGRPREVLRVTPATSPMPVAVLVDNSQAATDAIAEMRRALTGFVNGIDGLGPMALVTVADRPTIVVDYTTAAKTMLDGVGRLFAQPASGATLLDAIREVSNGLRKREADRAAIVILTTENTEFSTLYYAQVLDAVRESGVSMHAVVLLNPRGSMQTEEARNRATVLDRGPRDSGGLRVDVVTSQSFEVQMSHLAAILKSQYRLVYARPETLIPPERTEVTTTHAGFEARGTPARGQAAK